MKFLLTSLTGLMAAGLVSAQQAPAKPPPKPAATPQATAPAKPRPSTSRTEIRSTANQMAAGIEAAEAALTPAELAIAERVHVGRLPCELGAFVVVTPDPKSPGYFDVQVGKARYRMYPVESRTGAIRLEDRKAEALWLQLANKSMLINRKLGQRMADACMSPQQTAVAAEMEKNPAPSVLDAPAAAASASPGATAPAAALPAPASSVPVSASVTVAQPATAAEAAVPAPSAAGAAPTSAPAAAAPAVPASR